MSFKTITKSHSNSTCALCRKESTVVTTPEGKSSGLKQIGLVAHTLILGIQLGYKVRRLLESTDIVL